MTNVIKATGEIENFSKDKVISSIKRAGIPQNLQDDVLKHVEEKLYDNIPTSEIYNHITEFLTRKEPILRTKYSLKKAIMDLGPTGYPFEDYVAEVFKEMGYTTETRSLLNGKCVTHEVDIVAQTKDTPQKRLLIEAKFHNTPGTRTEVQVALYTKARFEDVKEKNNLDQAYLVTNTKITSDALSYALCENLGVLSWSYPHEESLRDLVEKYRLFPVTFLESLSRENLQTLLTNHIVLLRDLIKKPENLDILSLEDVKKKKIIEEAKSIIY